MTLLFKDNQIQMCVVWDLFLQACSSVLSEMTLSPTTSARRPTVKRAAGRLWTTRARPKTTPLHPVNNHPISRSEAWWAGRYQRQEHLGFPSQVTLLLFEGAMRDVRLCQISGNNKHATWPNNWDVKLWLCYFITCSLWLLTFNLFCPLCNVSHPAVAPPALQIAKDNRTFSWKGHGRKWNVALAHDSVALICN